MLLIGNLYNLFINAVIKSVLFSGDKQETEED